ncbi:MAG TPA: hypothetical protein VNF47_05770 [Streptosporangiaceae bacterium]|nr:hypothetical protein [Streptosporangiaceae bacterium]
MVSGLLAGLPATAGAQAAPTAPAVTIGCGNVTALRVAIVAANLGGPSTIFLAPHCTYLIRSPVLPVSVSQGAVGLPIVTRHVTLIGDHTTILRFSRARFRIAEVAGSNRHSASLTIRGITLRNGQTSGLFGTPGHGGCVLVTTAGRTRRLGGSTLVLLDSELEDCSAGDGGGIYADSHTDVLATGSSVQDNIAGDGGGIYVDSGGDLVMSKSFVSDNSAHHFLFFHGRGGGLYNDGDARLIGVNLIANRASLTGGGIYTDDDLFLGVSFLQRNQAGISGGGLFADHHASTHIAASTFQANTAHVSGGGIANFGNALLQMSFITQNVAPFGGGIFEGFSGVFIILNSLVAGNIPNNCRPFASVPLCFG